jgi:hypothetical protein
LVHKIYAFSAGKIYLRRKKNHKQIANSHERHDEAFSNKACSHLVHKCSKNKMDGKKGGREGEKKGGSKEGREEGREDWA